MKEIKWLFEVSKELKTGIVAYCYDFIDKLQLIDFSAKLMESGYYEDDIEILAGGELYDYEVFRNVVYDKKKKITVEEKAKEIKKIELADLLELRAEKLSGDELRGKLEYINAKYSYPEEFISFSRYSSILLVPEEALDKAILFLQKV